MFFFGIHRRPTTDADLPAGMPSARTCEDYARDIQIAVVDFQE